MTTTPESLLDQQVFFVGLINIPISTSLWNTAQSMSCGDVLTISSEIVEAGYPRDRRGHWLELADDEKAQIERWGEVKFGLGGFPDHLPSRDPHLTLADLMTEKYVNKSTTLNAAPQRYGSFSVTQHPLDAA